MILLFDKRFIKPIQDGIKIHTIRLDEKNRWKGFKVIHFKAWSGKGYRSPMIDIIERKSMHGHQHVFMSINEGHLRITINMTQLFSYAEKNEFAIKEGFDNWQDFENYFYPIVDKMKDQCYSGKLIHWTDKRY
jgi:hypothetical protein